MVYCKITKVHFAAADDDKKAFDFAAVVDCCAFDPNDPEYIKAGITRELVEARIDRFTNQHVDPNHVSPDVDPSAYKGSVIGFVFNEEDGKGYMNFGVTSKEYADYIEESGAGVSLEWIIAKNDFGETIDVTPSNIAVCEPGKMNPRCKTAETLAVHAVAMGIYEEATGPIYADPKNALFPCTYSYEVIDSIVLVVKLYNSDLSTGYTEDEWSDIMTVLLKRAAECGI